MQRVCVFCGSAAGKRPEYEQAAHSLGSEIASRGLGLVFGGARIGLMGQVADAAIKAGTEVIGVIPQRMVDRRIAHEGLTELRIVQSMHERKELMARLSDGFIAMPGGLGTLEEIFEAITWSQLKLHKKPCGFLNILSYYDKLFDFLDLCTSELFIRPQHRDMLVISDTPKDLIDAMLCIEFPAVEKWRSGTS